MAEDKKYFHNLDGENNRLKNFLLNPLTTVQRTAKGLTLGINDEGYVCFDVTLNKQYFWDGGQWIEVSGGGGAITTAVTADLQVGAIDAGDIVPVGTTLQGLTELLLLKTFFPDLIAPTFSLSNDAGIKEVGTIVSFVLTFTFNRGQIKGALVSGVWDPNATQNPRAGASVSYTIRTTTQAGNTLTVTGYTVLNGSNSFTGTVTYAVGPQPLDSKGANFNTPLVAGTSPLQSTSFTGIYPYYWYKSSTQITAADMKTAIENGTATKVVGVSTGTITINFGATGQYLAFAYPASSTTKTIWFVNAFDFGTIPGGVFGSASTLAVSASTSSPIWSNIDYKIHVTAGLITQTSDMQLRNS
jgi:hypothetical protein